MDERPPFLSEKRVDNNILPGIFQTLGHNIAGRTESQGGRKKKERGLSLIYQGKKENSDGSGGWI
jgi:hypothetical protein